MFDIGVQSSCSAVVPTQGISNLCTGKENGRAEKPDG